MMMEKVLLNHGNTWKADEVKLKLKSGNIMHLDPRSATHKAPFWTGRYDDTIIDQFTSVFQKDWVVMDIGANIGYYALSFARALKQLGGGTVIAVEPLPANAAKLQQHIALNGLDAMLTIERMALGDKNGTITIYATESGNTGNAYIGDKPIEQVKGTSSCDIPIERLDDCRLTKRFAPLRLHQDGYRRCGDPAAERRSGIPEKIQTRDLWRVQFFLHRKIRLRFHGRGRPVDATGL